ncbi:chorismate synthase [Crocinitomix catalasitica]|uniref:chorismate synthase n=1 Tax=Crocinitomix catalasitica TaxID=184607 RepID=UPI0004899796|nr:chorismate synthase [Crocinitomix catalasitica]
MAGNSFGELFKLTSFGESHGIAIGGVIDGCPSNFELDLKEIQNQLDRRKPGQSVLTTQRKESDTVEFISGIFEGTTLGTPIGFILKNEDQKSKDYDRIGQVFRPSHADYTTEQKYGIRDYRGGGRSSARETAVRVVAGAIAQQILRKLGVEIYAYVSQVGTIKLKKEYADVNPIDIDKNIVRCPDPEIAERMAAYIKEVRAEGDTVGGMVTCVAKNCPVGIGEPVYDRLNADLAKAMFSINAVKGFELGSGFDSIAMKGSVHNDSFEKVGDKISTKTNFSGGIQGGISNGQDIYFNVAFKPVATIIKNQTTVNTAGEPVEFKGEGRHDPCVVPRAVPIVDAMCALVILDHYLRHKATIQF